MANDSQKKILIVVNDAEFFLSHRAPLARAARTAGFEVEIATPPGPGAARIRDEGFVHHVIRMSRSGTRPVDNLRSIASLIRLYRRVRPDLVHHVTMKPVLYGSLSARVAGVARIVNTHTGMGYVFIEGGHAARIMQLTVRNAYRLMLRKATTRIVFHNPDDLAALVDPHIMGRQRAVIVGGAGVDVQAYLPTPERAGPPVVILAARLLWQKGVGEFVEAATRLRSSGVAARFALVGETDPHSPSAVPRSTMLEWERAGIVELWGRRHDMPEVFGESHIVCLPSYGEGIPKVLLEAAACARPIVSTDVPGCREIARHEQNALLVPARDAPALASALRQLIESAPERARLGARGRDIAVNEFNEERVVGQTMRVYLELLA